MVTTKSPPRTPEELFLIWTIGLTYLWYAAGALYVVGPVAVWLLLLLTLWRFVIDHPLVRPPSLGVWIWWIATLALLFALLIAHFDNHLGMGQTIKSTIGWAKGWALFPACVTIGACLNIRLAALSRAANILGLQTLLIAPFLIAASLLGLPNILWTSPLQAVGGPGPEFFSLVLYGISPDGDIRFSFFAPWAPGAGIAAIVLAATGMWDKSRFWRIFGVLGALLIVVLVKSRLAMIGLPVVLGVSYFVTKMDKPWVLFLGAGSMLALGLAAGAVIDGVLDAKAAFDGYRAKSTEVRAVLQSIAQHRYVEAPIWGHGIQDKGIHATDFMPIGSHHTWNGLLFVKGLVGLFAFAGALIWTTFELIVRGHRSPVARVGLATILAMWIYGFGENLEILIYLFWIGMVAVGRGMAVPRPVMPTLRERTELEYDGHYRENAYG